MPKIVFPQKIFDLEKLLGRKIVVPGRKDYENIFDYVLPV